MKNPKVSICVPTYNQTEYLKKTLESIVIQTFSDYEVIVTDDSSTEDVKNLVDSFREQFREKILYQKNSIQKGSPANWNMAISLAKGDLIKILHHDEWFNSSDALGIFVDVMVANPKITVAFSSAVANQISSGKTWIHMPNPNILRNISKRPSLLQLGNIIGSPSNLIYRKMDDFEYDIKLKWLVDIEFYIRLINLKGQFKWIEEPLITSITGAKHNVTNDCIDDRTIQIFEHVYTFQEFCNTNSIFTNLKFVLHFVRLFKRFNVKSKSDLVECGYKSEIHWVIRISLFLSFQ